MRNMLKLLLISTSLLACSKPENVKPAPSTPSAVEAAQQKPPLSTYLDGAVVAKVFELKSGSSNGIEKKEVRQLDDKETKEYLALVGLAQRADGGLVRCPDDLQVELSNAEGMLLGTIGYCKGHARFDAPDGTSGGINASRP